jgi:hypothetical protein
MPHGVGVDTFLRTGVERRDGGDLVGGEREVEDVDVLGKPLGFDDRGIATTPRSMAQRSTTCAGVLPYVAAIVASVGSFSRSSPCPSGLQATVMMSCARS